LYIEVQAAAVAAVAMLEVVGLQIGLVAVAVLVEVVYTAAEKLHYMPQPP
jgi:hypothetical protein